MREEPRMTEEAMRHCCTRLQEDAVNDPWATSRKAHSCREPLGLSCAFRKGSSRHASSKMLAHPTPRCLSPSPLVDRKKRLVQHEIQVLPESCRQEKRAIGSGESVRAGVGRAAEPFNEPSKSSASLPLKAVLGGGGGCVAVERCIGISGRSQNEVHIMILVVAS